MKQYLDLMQNILDEGEVREDRTGTGTISLFGPQLEFDLSKGFPLVTTRKMFPRIVIEELLWFMRGSTNVKELEDKSVWIWSDWKGKNDSIGPMYGYNLRRWKTSKGKIIDQIEELIEGINSKPFSRRHMITTLNIEHLPDESISPQENVNKGKGCLAPCHGLLTQFYVSKDNKLSCKMTQRSGDYFLGVATNIASYALLTHMIAQQCNLEIGKLIMSFGDVHLYSNHQDKALLQLTREPLPLPTLVLDKATSIFDYRYEDFHLINYQSHGKIIAPISV